MAKLSMPDAIAEFHAHMVTDESHGYSQPNRYGTGGTHTVTLSDGTQLKCRNGDKDCSSSVAEVVGRLLGRSDPFTYTGDECPGLLDTGVFTQVPVSQRKRGDILWRTGHTGIYQGGGKVSEFVRSENYTINGRTGDQDGREALIAWDSGNWTRCFRYSGAPREGVSKPARVPTPVPDSVPTRAILRMYNPNSGEHFYTANVTEAKGLVKAGWDCEGVGWIQPTKGADVYRLYNPNAGDHHYTTNAAERDMLKRLGWRYEGVSFKSGGKVPIYRLYNPNSGRHHHTTSEGEKNSLVKIGWRYEGVGWYAEKGA